MHLDDYKSGKGEGTSKNHNPSQESQKSTNRTASDARNPSSKGRSEVSKPSSNQQSGGTTNRDNQLSPHRKLSGRMESHTEVAASREPEKHHTQWEAEQQIKSKNANPPTESVKRSESREPKPRK